MALPKKPWHEDKPWLNPDKWGRSPAAGALPDRISLPVRGDMHPEIPPWGPMPRAPEMLRVDIDLERCHRTRQFKVVFRQGPNRIELDESMLRTQPLAGWLANILIAEEPQ